MATVYLGLGSNINPETNLRMAVVELRKQIGDLTLSSVVQSAPLGFQGDDFLNAVARVKTTLSAREICSALDGIHDLAGRPRGSARFVARPLDIDLLLYDQQIIDDPPVRVPRCDILEYSFVLLPLAEIAPDLVHPVSGQTIADHVEGFDETSHPLTWSDLTL